MKKTIKLTKVMRNIAIIAVAAIIGFSMVTCGKISDSRDLKYSLQVNNQAATVAPLAAHYAAPRAAAAFGAEDKVELFIVNLEYNEDADNRALIIIANGDKQIGTKGILNNAGWYDVNTKNLAVTNDINNGPYSSLTIRVNGLRVNGKEYTLQALNVFFGNPTSVWHPEKIYTDKFSGIVIDDSTKSLKTILTIDPDILGTPNADGYNNEGVAEDPYKYIKVEGIVN